MKYIVLAYDISDDRKRDRLANLLEDYGQRVQYSVFECRLDEMTFDKLLGELKPFADGNDSIRIYQVCETCLKKMLCLGRAELTGEPGFFLV